MFQDREGRPNGLIKIKIKHYTQRCKRSTNYFARAFEIQTQSSKRCSSMGSCQGEKCNSISRDSEIPELQVANTHLGNTGCIESCGGPSCGCGWLTSGCLFYRNYATLISIETYEIFSCDEWPMTTIIKININQFNETERKKIFELQAESLVKWKNIQISMSTFTKEETSIANYYFNKEKGYSSSKVAIIQSILINNIKDSICETEIKAKNMNCTLEIDTCQCNNAETITNCQCKDGSIIKEIMNENTLPNLIGNHLITYENDQIIMHDNKVVTNLEIKLEGYSTMTKIDSNQCEINIDSIKGCYSCDSGVKLEYRCKSTLSDTIRNLMCKTTEFAIKCSTKEKNETVNVQFNDPHIDEECQLRCSASIKRIQIKAELIQGSTYKGSQYFKPICTNCDQFINEIPSLKTMFNFFSYFSFTYFIITLSPVLIFLC